MLERDVVGTIQDIEHHLQGSCLHVSTLEQPNLAAELAAGGVLGIEWTSPTSLSLTVSKKAVGQYSRPV